VQYIHDELYLTHLQESKLSKTKNLQKQIYKLLLDLITKGILQSMVILSDKKISLTLNVSKSPVREALKRLEQDELIRIMPQSKTYVLPINIKKVRSSYIIREALELMLIREAIKHVTQDDILILESLLQKQQVAINKDDIQNFYLYDVAFHFHLAKTARLLDAWNILEKINLHIDRVRCQKNVTSSLNVQSIKDHGDILEAIKNRNQEEAKKLMSLHLTRVIVLIDKELEKE